jgi:hypothetical protein
MGNVNASAVRSGHLSYARSVPDGSCVEGGDRLAYAGFKQSGAPRVDLGCRNLVQRGVAEIGQYVGRIVRSFSLPRSAPAGS